MLPLHETHKQKFESYIILNVKDNEEHKKLLNSSKNFSGPKIYYHNECRVNFNNKISLSEKPSNKSDWHNYRDYHQIVFEEVSSIIEEDVMKKRHCHLLTYLHELYTDSLEKLSEENSVEMNSTFTAHHLEEKIMKVFSKDIKFFIVNNKKVSAPKYLQAVDDTIFENLQTENILQKAALLLRKSILKIEKKNCLSRIFQQNIQCQEKYRYHNNY